MRPLKGILCLGLLFLSLGIANRAAGGDDHKNQANWDKLKQLSDGQEVEVVENGAVSNRGSFRSLTDEAMVVTMVTGEKTISRQKIVRVSSKGQKHRTRNALIGAGIGAGAGAGIGAAATSCTSGCFGFTRGNAMGVLSAVGAIGGAIVGAVLPTGGWHEVYRAR